MLKINFSPKKIIMLLFIVLVFFSKLSFGCVEKQITELRNKITDKETQYQLRSLEANTIAKKAADLKREISIAEYILAGLYGKLRGAKKYYELQIARKKLQLTGLYMDLEEAEVFKDTDDIEKIKKMIQETLFEIKKMENIIRSIENEINNKAREIARKEAIAEVLSREFFKVCLEIEKLFNEIKIIKNELNSAHRKSIQLLDQMKLVKLQIRDLGNKISSVSDRISILESQQQGSLVPPELAGLYTQLRSLQTELNQKQADLQRLQAEHGC